MTTNTTTDIETVEYDDRVIALATYLDIDPEEIDDRVIALAAYLDIDPKNIEQDYYNDDQFEAESCTYLVVDDEDADLYATNYIMNSLWAFNAEFIIEHTDLPYEAIDMIRDYQSNQYENANDTIFALINDIDKFIKAAISSDGRGHFITSYDGEEIEQGEYYIYRMD